jgi:hypothetical protein
MSPGWLIPNSEVESEIPARKPLNPKTEIEPQITQIDTDFEEVVETIMKPFW